MYAGIGRSLGYGRRRQHSALFFSPFERDGFIKNLVNSLQTKEGSQKLLRQAAVASLNAETTDTSLGIKTQYDLINQI